MANADAFRATLKRTNAGDLLYVSYGLFFSEEGVNFADFAQRSWNSMVANLHRWYPEPAAENSQLKIDYRAEMIQIYPGKAEARELGKGRIGLKKAPYALMLVLCGERPTLG